MLAENSRKMDGVGRVILPGSIRQFYGLNREDVVEVQPMDDGIKITPAAEPAGSSAGVRRTLDCFGRMTVPKQERERLGWKENDRLEFLPYFDSILIKKQEKGAAEQ